jgi:cytochrome c peroxidase
LNIIHYILALSLMYIKLKFSEIIKVSCFILLVGCSLTKSQYHELKESPHLLIFEQYGKDFNDFQNKLVGLNLILNDKTGVEKSIGLKEKLVEVRLAYKKIEFIFDYLEPKYAYLYINGGPLPKLHREVAEIDIVAPNGLQRLDELIFMDESSEGNSEIVLKTKELLRAVAFIKDSHLRDTISKQNSIEFLRSGIVRVFTLGITGFDTPGSGNGISESIVSLKAMRIAFSYYRNDLNADQRYIFNKILSLYKSGITQLENNQDFDSFDRLKFLKRVVNPLYKELLTFQNAVDIEDASLNIHAQNYRSENLFDADFLDVNYFSQYSFSDIND